MTDKLIWKAQGQYLFRVPPPNPIFRYKPSDLEKAILKLMHDFQLDMLEARRP